MSNRTKLSPHAVEIVDPPAENPRDSAAAPRSPRVPESTNPTAAGETTSEPRNSRVFTRGRPFQSGNPGRPKGARNKITRLLESMFDGEAERIGRKAVELAREGRLGAVKLVLDRAYPSRKRHADGVVLPALNTAADAVAAMSAIAAAVSEGAISTEQARDLSAVIDAFRKTYDLADIEHRLAALEKARRTEKARRAAYGPGAPPNAQ